jgi:hypothetical protein
MLGHCRLTHVKLGNQLADGTLSLEEQLQDPPPVRLGEDVEGEGCDPRILP